MFCSSGAAQLGTVRRFYLEAEASGSYYQPLAKKPMILAANFVNGVNLRDRPVLLDHLELLSGDLVVSSAPAAARSLQLLN